MVGTRTTQVASLPRGSVRLLRRSLGRGARAPIAWCRAVHVAWLVRVLGPDRTRVVATFEGDHLVAVAVTVRYDAAPAPRDVAPLLGAAMATGACAPLLLGLDPVATATVLTLLAALGALGALVFDGASGRHGARRARVRAAQLGPDRAWGRGLVAVAPGSRGRGHGGVLVAHLVASLPPGDAWLPVAMTPDAARFYRRLGARPLDGAACEFVAR